jgi:hypothetical protein
MLRVWQHRCPEFGGLRRSDAVQVIQDRWREAA